MTANPDRYLAAVIQMQSGEDKAKNLATAERLVEDAAQRGAKLIALPEMFNSWSRLEIIVQQAETIPGETSEYAASWAKRWNVVLVAGSLAEQCANSQKAFNTSLVFGPDGNLLAKYRKQHLFDVEIPGQVVACESGWFQAGDTDVVCDTAVGRLGQAICYDLRFPELFGRLSRQGADLLVIPSAFSRPTGAAHWEILLRARAIENQAFVLAPNQCGTGPGMATFGHSQIIDPWGQILATAHDEAEAIVLAELDLNRLREVRSRLPCLEHRRS